SAGRAPRVRRDRPPTSARGMGRADSTGAADRATRSRGPVEQGDRRTAVRLPPDGRHAPLPPVPQARYYIAQRAARCVEAGPHLLSRRSIRPKIRHATYATDRPAFVPSGESVGHRCPLTSKGGDMSANGKPSIVFCHGVWADGSSFSKLIPTL